MKMMDGRSAKLTVWNCDLSQDDHGVASIYPCGCISVAVCDTVLLGQISDMGSDGMVDGGDYATTGPTLGTNSL